MSVVLVGAGPGDPGLITARGLELVRSCDVLIHDRLVAPALVDEAPADAIRIAHEPHTQAEINSLLVSYGRAGFTVVRLKGGDPFVFGRGGEEALALAEAGVEYEVVPGVSALSAVPAAAGIPITHRGLASQVTVVTAHCSREGRRPDYAALARTPGTLVFFMAGRALGEIAAVLIEHGRAPSTPAAAIASGTLPEQQVVVAPLAEVAGAAEELESPVLLVVGEVVSLARQTAVRSLAIAAGGAPAASRASSAAPRTGGAVTAIGFAAGARSASRATTWS
jgi:uroporphyrin-III C-methyltransferase